MITVLIMAVLLVATAIGASSWTSKKQMLKAESANQRLRESTKGWATFTVFVAAGLVLSTYILLS